MEQLGAMLPPLQPCASDNQLLPALVFWSSYLATRYLGPTSSLSTDAPPTTRAPSTILKVWCGVALAVNIIYFTMHRTVGRRHDSLEASARLLFSMTQLVSLPYAVWDYDPPRDGRQLSRILWDGACIPVLLMLADCIAGAPSPLVPMDIVFYAQSVFWAAALRTRKIVVHNASGEKQPVPIGSSESGFQAARGQAEPGE